MDAVACMVGNILSITSSFLGMFIELQSMLCIPTIELRGEFLVSLKLHLYMCLGRSTVIFTCTYNVYYTTMYLFFFFMHECSRGGTGVNVAKTLDLLKAVMQSSFNQEVKKLCDDYFQVKGD